MPSDLMEVAAPVSAPVLVIDSFYGPVKGTAGELARYVLFWPWVLSVLTPAAGRYMRRHHVTELEPADAADGYVQFLLETLVIPERTLIAPEDMGFLGSLLVEAMTRRLKNAHGKAARRREASLDSAAALVPDRGHGVDALEAAEFQQKVLRAIADGAGPDSAACFALRLDGFTLQATAQKLDLSLTTAWRRLMAARTVAAACWRAENSPPGKT